MDILDIKHAVMQALMANSNNGTTASIYNFEEFIADVADRLPKDTMDIQVNKDDQQDHYETGSQSFEVNEFTEELLDTDEPVRPLRPWEHDDRGVDPDEW